MTDKHTPLTAGEIEELKALEAKATPGPWAWEFAGDDNTCAVGTVMDENDNFIAGMVGQDADTVVVDSVCPEVSNQQDAAFIAAARNALPRLLSLITPPPDAAVREAVEAAEDLLAQIKPGQYCAWEWPIRGLLRAVQARAEYAEARVRELEDFKARVMEWAWEDCRACSGMTEDACGQRVLYTEKCYGCVEYSGDDDAVSLWAPAWEVGV